MLARLMALHKGVQKNTSNTDINATTIPVIHQRQTDTNININNNNNVQIPNQVSINTTAPIALTKDNIACMSIINKLVDSYGFNLTNAKIDNSSMSFIIDASGIECIINIAQIASSFFLNCKSEIGLNYKSETNDLRRMKKKISSVFKKLLSYNTYSKIKYDFREKLGQEYISCILNDSPYDSINLNVNDIIVNCKIIINTNKVQDSTIISNDNNTVSEDPAEQTFNVIATLGLNKLIDTTLSQISVIKLIQYYYSSCELQFLVKTLNLFAKFNPQIIDFNDEESNSDFELVIHNLGPNKSSLKIFHKAIVSTFSNPLSQIYYIEYDDSPNYIEGSNLLKLLYIMTNSDMNEFRTFCNMKEEQENTRKTKTTRIKIPKAQRVKVPKAQKVKVPKVKVPKVKAPKCRNPVPRFVREAATYVPSRHQPYPISFATLERTINTFNANHKAVLVRFNDPMTEENFIAFKNSFNSQVGFTADQAKLIQMLPNDKDYVMAFFKVYDLI